MAGDPGVAFHRKILALRDKHIAHSVNASEFIKFGVMVGSLGSDKGEGVTGLIALVGADWEPPAANVEGLRRLAKALLDGVLLTANEHAPALRAAAEAAGLDQVRTWPELVYERGDADPEIVRER